MSARWMADTATVAKIGQALPEFKAPGVLAEIAACFAGGTGEVTGLAFACSPGLG